MQRPCLAITFLYNLHTPRMIQSRLIFDQMFRICKLTRSVVSGLCHMPHAMRFYDGNVHAFSVQEKINESKKQLLKGKRFRIVCCQVAVCKIFMTGNKA